MWCYDKLFAEGNVVGVKSLMKNEIHAHEVLETWVWGVKCINWWNYMNPALKLDDFQIEYIIRLDEHGNVVEKLFDRERDMTPPMPNLEDGYFVEVTGQGLGIVLEEFVTYQNGEYGELPDIEDSIVKIWDSTVVGFNDCKTTTPIWEKTT